MLQLLNYASGGGAQSNYVYIETEPFRLSDNGVTIYYLMALTNTMENETSYVLISKETLNERYTKFDINLSSFPVPALGAIDLGRAEGFFSWILYEQTSNSNLDPTDSSVVGTLNTGSAYLRNPVSEVSFTEYSTTDTNTVYVNE